MSLAVCGDIGATNTRAVIVDYRHGHVLARYRRATDARDPQHTLTDLWQWVSDQRREFDANVVAAGFGVAADVVNGVVGKSGNLPGWEWLELRKQLAEMFGLASRQVAVENDAVMSAFSEYEKLLADVAFIPWGSGIGVAVLLTPEDRSSRAWPRIHATEKGHNTLDMKSRMVCGCGGRGHWEALVGGTHLEELLGRPIAQAEDRHWLPVLEVMAVGIRNVSSDFPRIPIFIGGGVMLKQQHRFPLLCDLVREMKSTVEQPSLHLATHGERAGLIGAIYRARQLN